MMDTFPFVPPALLLGVVFDLILFGILTAQVYIYYISFPKDRILLKTAVVWVYLAGIAQTGLALLDLFICLTSGLSYFVNGVVTDFQQDHLWISITALTGAVAIVIQSLYAQRIYLISKKRWLAAMITCMSVAQIASSILGAVCYAPEDAIFPLYPPLALGVSLLGESTCHLGFTWIWGPINIACDLTITICMVTFVSGIYTVVRGLSQIGHPQLLRHRQRTIRHKTRSHITKIVQIVIETGMSTTALLIIYTALFIPWDLPAPSPFFPLPGLMMSKVYSNSMLVLLNNRATIVNGRNDMDSFEFVEVPARCIEGDIELRTRRGNATASTQTR